MSEIWQDPEAPDVEETPERPRRRRQREREHGGHGARARQGRRRKDLTPEERALLEARRAASRKMGFLAHLVPYASVCLFLLFVAGFRAASIVAMAWGIGLACHYFFAIVAPGLRERMVRDEVDRRVHRGVSAERRVLADEHAQRLEQLSASIAHEIRNPITAAKSLVQQMGEDPASDENVEYAHVALDELDRVERSISHLLRFAREEEVSMGEVEMADLISSALDTLRDRVERLGVRITRDFDHAGRVEADQEKLRRVVINLVGNALDALEESATGDPRIEIQAGDNLAGSEVWVRIRDNGPGMTPEQLGRIFTPFYTSKSNGTGLGLAISKKLVDAHGGRIEAESRPGGGTEFVVTLPKDHAPHEEEAR